jgi:hypothetical protein
MSGSKSLKRGLDMKIRFVCSPIGRPEYRIGNEVEFNGSVQKTFARKYIERGWAVEVERSTGLAAIGKLGLEFFDEGPNAMIGPIDARTYIHR